MLRVESAPTSRSLRVANFPAAARHPAVHGHNSSVSEIKLNGGEITILKTLGLTGAQMAGTQLVDRIEEMEGAEFLDTLTGLIDQDYVVCEQGKYSHHGCRSRRPPFASIRPFPANCARRSIPPGREAGYADDAGGGPDYRVSEDSPIEAGSSCGRGSPRS